MKAALCDNRKNKIFSLIHILYSPDVWEGLQACYCAGYKLGCRSSSSSIDKWIKYEQ